MVSSLVKFMTAYFEEFFEASITNVELESSESNECFNAKPRKRPSLVLESEGLKMEFGWREDLDMFGF